MIELSSYQTAVMDWGIGGLSVYREIKRRDPNRSIVYFSDSGITPYGKLPPRELESRAVQVCEYFTQNNMREIVLACNAAGTVASQLRSRYKSSGVRIMDVISSGIRLVKSTSFRRVGVIGGQRTILSRIYQCNLTTARRKIIGRIAQPLSALIERGELDSPAMEATLAGILAPLHRCDAVLLACTHYPAVEDLIQFFVPKTRILDPAALTARELVGSKKTKRRNGPHDLFLTTGDPLQSVKSAYLAFGTRINRFVRIQLPGG
jgi:glutamate racemase